VAQVHLQEAALLALGRTPQTVCGRGQLLRLAMQELASWPHASQTVLALLALRGASQWQARAGACRRWLAGMARGELGGELGA